MRRICPRCRRSYPTHAGVCASDGAALLVVDPTGCPRAGTQLDDNLTILSLLGAGAMGTVYRGLQHSMGREVAVKVARPEYAESEDAVRRFLQEAGLASRLNHPNIITLFDFGRTKQGELFIMMELLEGRPLSHLIAAEGRVAPTRTVALMNQVCDAVHHAHEMDLVHRDLKPDNIFVIDGAGHLGDFVKVLDFGIAKVPVTQGGTPLTRTGAVCGTPAYMSPEQAGSKAVDRRSDVYALGVIAYELLCGARPFSGESTMEVLLAHLFTEPPTFATFAPDLEFPPALEEGVRSALSKQPARRPATAADFKERLRAAVYPAESGSRRTTPRPVAASGNHLDSTTLFGETPEPIPTATAPADEDPTSRSGMIALVALAASIMLIGAISAAIWVRTTLQEDVTLELQSPASLATVTPTATPAAEPPRMPAVQLEQGIATGWERVRGASRAPVEGARRARRGGRTPATAESPGSSMSGSPGADNR